MIELNRERINAYQRFPDLFMKEMLGVNPWKKQVDISRLLSEHRRVTVRSAHNLGKTFIAACLVLWHFTCFPPPNRTITTAPTFRQVKDLLWSEINALHPRLLERVSYAGEALQVKLKGRTSNHYAIGYSTDEPDKFVGHHALNLLVIFDEACGISRGIFEASEGILSAEKNRVLLIGNPTQPNVYFHHTHIKKDMGFKSVRLSAFDSPNIRLNPDTNKWEDVRDADGNLPYPSLVSLAWAKKMIRTYGENAPNVVSRVFGEFPIAASDQLIDDISVENALYKGFQVRAIVERLKKGGEKVSAQELRRLSLKSEKKISVLDRLN
jgi:hypothetical protein